MTFAMKLKALGSYGCPLQLVKTPRGSCNSTGGGWGVFWKCTVSILAFPDSKCGDINVSSFAGNSCVVWNR